MPLEQAGPPPMTSKQSTGTDAWLNQPRSSSGVPASNMAEEPAWSYATSALAAAGHGQDGKDPLAKGVDHIGDQATISQQLLNQQPKQHHRSPPLLSSAQAAPPGHDPIISPSHSAPLHAPGRLLDVMLPTFSRPAVKNMQSHFSRLGVSGDFTMEIDELANTDEDEVEFLPLVTSDLDPRYTSHAGVKKKPPTEPTNASGLNMRQSQTPQKTNGPGRKATTPLRQPVISIPLAGSTPTHRPHPASPGRILPMSVSVSIPTTYSPSGGSGGGIAAGTPKNTTPLTTSPVVAVGRRSETVTDVRIKGGRPKGWKPGMSYREVALRNLGVDPNDPTVPPEILLPPRAKKPNRGPGRPRIPGRPTKIKPSHMLAKRIGRPPIQPIESVQRSIFLNSTAYFAPFLCEWTGCRAELQNMATLRKHVIVIHGQSVSSVASTCQWRRCATLVLPVQFRDEADAAGRKGERFLEHMEYHHLAPVEWHRGDGVINNSLVGPPQPPAAAALLTKVRARATGVKHEHREENTSVPTEGGAAAIIAAPEIVLDDVPPEDLPRYLLDDQGRQVTPLLRDPLLESSALFRTHDERARRLKEMYRQQQQYLNKRPNRSWGRLM